MGGAGGNAINNMIVSGLSGVDFVVANTDAQALGSSRAQRIIQMGLQLTEGLGAGSRPEIGKAAAEEALEEIRDCLAGSNMVFLAAGMGGGTGTGAAPVIAAAAREMGILTVGVVTTPFHFESGRRMRVAEAGIAELREIGAGEAAEERRAHRAAEAAIANPLFDDASLKGARGVLISITGGKDLTLYEVDEAASRIRQEVDEEANIIVGAIIEPALEQAMRVSVVATGIDQSASSRMAAQSFAEPIVRPNIAPPSLGRIAGAPVSAVESRPLIAAGTEFETPPLLAPVIPFPEPTGRRQTLDEEAHFDPPAIRRLLDKFAVAASQRRQARRASA